jgi:hypothetical protein
MAVLRFPLCSCCATVEPDDLSINPLTFLGSKKTDHARNVNGVATSIQWRHTRDELQAGVLVRQGTRQYIEVTRTHTHTDAYKAKGG